MAHLQGFCASCACNLRGWVQSELIFHCMPGKGDWERGKKLHMSHFAIWFVSANQPESMSFRNELSCTPLSNPLPCACLFSHQLTQKCISSYWTGEALSFLPSCHVKVNCFVLLYLPPLHHHHPDKSTPHPHPTLCAGLEVEMREEVGGFDWPRCWDVILSKLKSEVCACLLIVCMCPPPQKKK